MGKSGLEPSDAFLKDFIYQTLSFTRKQVIEGVREKIDQVKWDESGKGDYLVDVKEFIRLLDKTDE